MQTRFATACTGLGVHRRRWVWSWCKQRCKHGLQQLAPVWGCTGVAGFGAGANRGANTVCNSSQQPAPCCTGANWWTPYPPVCTTVCTAVCTSLFVVQVRAAGDTCTADAAPSVSSSAVDTAARVAISSEAASGCTCMSGTSAEICRASETPRPSAEDPEVGAEIVRPRETDRLL